MTFKNPTREDVERFYKEFCSVDDDKDLLKETIAKYNQGHVSKALVEFIWHFHNVAWTNGYKEGGY